MTRFAVILKKPKGTFEELVLETEMLKQRLEWFQDLKFGVIFHYGLYAEARIVESWQLSEKDEWARENHPIEKPSKHCVWIIGS